MSLAGVDVREDLLELIRDVYSELDSQSIRITFCELVIDSARLVRTVVKSHWTVPRDHTELSGKHNLLEESWC